MPQIQGRMTFAPPVRIAQGACHAYRVTHVQRLAKKQFAVHRTVKAVDDASRNVFRNGVFRSVSGRADSGRQFQQLDLAHDKIVRIPFAGRGSGRFIV